LRFGILAGQGRFLYAESRNKQNWRDIDMRFLLKILFAPILAVLAVVTWFFVFVVSLSSGILCIPATILGFFGLFIIFVDSVCYGAGLLVIAFLISPYGLPMLATWLLAKLHVLRYAIQDRIYG
jgi:ABC-type multidrug transport system permease subunit